MSKRVSPLSVLTVVAALGNAAVGGLFFAFSAFVMRGLDRINPVDAVVAMRAINAAAQANPPFLTLFFGAAVTALAVGIVAVTQLARRGSGYLLAGAVLAVVALVVTAACNVPLNEQLDKVRLATDAAPAWHAYSGPWTAWNHVRTICPLLGAALLGVGLLRR
ncbi:MULTISPECIES: anthrone oxygenase family protein [Mycobacterium]|uniref:Membrane protein n=1 Tax=Mycobacterium kiyosense TaxID=2871094 RepID=A0A9P3Q8W6_9MYCO|nr:MULTISPECIES: anthrone oxygenase family protein [Mycobacterium]BDE11210.1 membrane protein [Mycobacterium sp. 20KCMC460]GLB85761.1 membrane protein [Mycobacterium kiyosense]GLB92419.1 membrane protein [Mycobacterium kiyosense]GLB98511.1 membrane protein [Mycobacterium kiyosense]GLC04708.1 membrane protein [Mycobacterium kiyosense]